MKNTVDIKTLYFTDVEFVEGILDSNPRIEQALYNHCRKYFYENYKAVFFCTEDESFEILQNAFIALWQNIQSGKIKVVNCVVVGKNNTPLNCSLTTYFMSIARNKYLELARSTKNDDCFLRLPSDDILNNDNNFIEDWLDDDYEKAMYEVISDSISVMPDHCSRLLTKFYYDKKKLDEMLIEIPEYTSKDALKSNKNRCLNRLKTYAQELYKIRKSH